MANEEHLKILRQGVEMWNAWRKENPGVRPDLTWANLRGAHLNRAHLSEANLSRADLSRADLRGADLSRAYLKLANLRKANLSGAILQEANLSEADLSEAILREASLQEADLIEADLSRAYLKLADLSWADLGGADFSGADFSGANFHGARIVRTNFGDVDLSSVKGLDTVRHDGPSTIGIDTIYHSGGNIPEAFLRGAGVPDTFITYIRSLVGTAIEYYSAFISFSFKNLEFAERLHNDLQSKDVRCWFAPEDMKIGDKIRVRIDDSIRLHDKLLLILSEESVASAWVEDEVEAALERERQEGKLVLFPVRLDDAVFGAEAGWAAQIRRSRHIGDFRHWKNHDDYRKGLERLLRDLKAG